MATRDPGSPVPVRPSAAVRTSAGSLRLHLAGILVFSSAVPGATQCYAQEVAEAARQERARKESQQKKSSHVYTAEDLKRAHILTPEDQAKIEARKIQPAPAMEQKAQQAVNGSAVTREVNSPAVAREDDAQSLPAGAPLGDVARHFRKQRESQQLQRSAEFHLPLADAPVLASPKPPVQPLLTPTVPLARPRIVPNLPRAKRSPFERPSFLPPASPRGLSSAAPAVRVSPPQPSARMTPSAPVKLNAVIVRPGDSLWKIARKNLGKGLRWQELLSINPGLRNPNRIEAGSQIFVPAVVSAPVTATKYVVREGDSLWRIARTQLGNGASWPCIARANPGLLTPNLIPPGLLLVLPGGCQTPSPL